MIITKTPLRISFAGGGTDLPAFYEQHGYGAVVSATIDKYVYIAIHPYFEGKFQLKYSHTEQVDEPSQIKHPLIRETLLHCGVTEPLEVTSFADIPSKGSGLGSSSAFCVGLIHALVVSKHRYLSCVQIAENACEVEMQRLGEPIGHQDQYATACGGLNFLKFNKGGSVFVERIGVPPKEMERFSSHLMMFYSGVTRDARSVLAEQRQNSSGEAAGKILLRMRDMAECVRNAFHEWDFDTVGRLMHEGWLLKREVASGISNASLDRYYDLARSAGAVGGRLLGAGGGGFFLFYVPPEKQPGVREALKELREFPFRFDPQGTRIALID